MIKWDEIKDGYKKEPPHRVEKTESEWKEQLSHEEFRITRMKGTEQRFSGEHCSRYDPGLYACTCCETKLFDSNEKFDSGTGWPSFTAPLENNLVKYEVDSAFGMTRIEVMCNVCDAHLGHVFPDGPPPSGLRYCINSVSLQKVD